LIKIDVNGTEHEISAAPLSYARVLELADKREGATVVYSGLWHGDSHRSGTLWSGKSITVEDGMRFTVVVTDNA